MDRLRHIGWLRVLTVLLVALGSTAVAAHPDGPSAEAYADAPDGGQGTVFSSGLSVLVAANAVGLMEAGPRGVERAAVDVAAPAAWSGEAPPLPAVPVAFERPCFVPFEEPPVRHRFCVYRL